MSGDSPTGRGYTQGSSSYTAADAEWLTREQRKWEERRRAPKCTCRNSLHSLDIDLCPIHGVML